MSREFFGIGVLLGLVIVTMLFIAVSEFLPQLVEEILVNIGVIASFIWVVIVMPRLVEA